MKEQCDFPAFTAYCLEENILHTEMKNVKELSAKDVEQINDCYLKIGNGKKVYVLVTFQGFIPLSDKAMKAANENKVQNMRGATAYVVDNLAQRLGVRFFMSFYKHKFPIAIFGTKDKAITWLRQEKKKNLKNVSELV
jgi:hypothetical protein